MLRIEKIELNRLPDAPESTEERYELVIVWKNRGRAPLTITRVGIGRTIAAHPPHPPMYHFFDGPTIRATVDKGEEYAFRTTDHMGVSPSHRKQIDLWHRVPMGVGRDSVSG